MQAPTHILAGVIIKSLLDTRRYRWAALTAIAVLSFLSHGILDNFARVTYHRPDADFSSAVWVGYHIAVLLVTIAFLYSWWRQFKWGIAFAILPDLDWVFIHGQNMLNVYIPFYRQPHLHNFLHRIFDNLPPVSYFSLLPDNRYNPLAAFWELLLVVVMIFLIKALASRRRNIHF